MIHETIVATLGAGGAPHLAPMGVRIEDGLYVIAPSLPSGTMDNLLGNGQAVINRS